MYSLERLQSLKKMNYKNTKDLGKGAMEKRTFPFSPDCSENPFANFPKV